MKLLLLCSLFLLSACNNLVFYQAQRVSVTLEASPQDVTKPLQANIGSKTRTFIIAPQIEASGSSKGELVSMLGYGAATLIDYAKDSTAPGTTPSAIAEGGAKVQKVTAEMGMEQMTFKTAFVSGLAAKNLAANPGTAKSTGTTGQTAQQLVQGTPDKKAMPKVQADTIAGDLGQQMTKAVKPEL
ncbi:MAG: hypothetical protein A2203_01695 [Chromatiales bacterium RIFOXYA1_FULL_46_5]|nr:MAG: hypothetical protein A2203_01695 [Chromatiales bacterium RIFOXYA1_FULL_46_5]